MFCLKSRSTDCIIATSWAISSCLVASCFWSKAAWSVIKRLWVNFWGNDTWREVGLSYPRCVIIQIRKRLPIPLNRRFALRLLGDPFL